MQQRMQLAVLQLHVDPVEHQLGVAHFALAAVVDQNVVTHLVQLVVEPALHNVVPQLVGALVLGAQVAARAQLHEEAHDVLRLAVAGGMGAHQCRPYVRVAAVDFQAHVLAVEALVEVEDQRQ